MKILVISDAFRVKHRDGVTSDIDIVSPCEPLGGRAYDLIIFDKGIDSAIKDDRRCRLAPGGQIIDL